jgi:hypothetical protein
VEAARYATIEDRKEAFHVLSVDITADIFAQCVRDSLVLGKVFTDR